MNAIMMNSDLRRSVWAHLTDNLDVEHAGFLLASVKSATTDVVLTGVSWRPVPPNGYVYRSDAYLELTDEFRVGVLKEAHARGVALVEFHSHTGPWPAAFSASDMTGFDEFVPHVRWRLRKPYAAVVVAQDGFDGLVWRQESGSPERLGEIKVDRQRMVPTHLTRLSGWSV